MIGALFRPRTYVQIQEFLTLRRWEWKFANRDELHQRQGWFYWAGHTFHPGYVVGGLVFMLVAGIDIVASLFTELVEPNTGLDKTAQFQKLIDEKKKNNQDKRKQFDLVRQTTEQARSGAFPREQES